MTARLIDSKRSQTASDDSKPTQIDSHPTSITISRNETITLTQSKFIASARSRLPLVLPPVVVACDVRPEVPIASLEFQRGPARRADRELPFDERTLVVDSEVRDVTLFLRCRISTDSRSQDCAECDREDERTSHRRGHHIHYACPLGISVL